MNREFRSMGGKEFHDEFKTHVTLVMGIDIKFAEHPLYQPHSFPFLMFDKLIHRPARVY